ncbi:MAG: glycosyltransferase family 2 protein [Kiritimatiellia bacterium]|jgi:dolichol-phosphate mannosyltransferase
MRYNLTMVMPVYNEAECIGSVVAAWLEQLQATAPAFRLLVINDGSRDGTARALDPFRGRPGVEVIDKANSGHGPTILMGCRKAVEDSDWVFQCDSDDEIPPDDFPAFWHRRDDADVIVGIRQNRAQPLARKIISAASRWTVRTLYRSGVRDVNCPFRLMRASALAPLLPKLDDDTFAPNVILSGLFALHGLRIQNLPVAYRPRRTGTVSLTKFSLWKKAFKAFSQTIAHRRSKP